MIQRTIILNNFTHTENGNQTPIEYYDNLDEVLVQENFIETMENEIYKLKRKN